MSKRKYSSSSSDDCDLDDDDSVFSSSSREREELKALFCNYIDRLSKRRKATKKRKVFTELVQSFSELPFLTKKKTKAKARKNIHKYHQRADSSNDEKAVLQKNNLRNFFEGRISKLCQAHATTFDFKSNPSDSSDSLNSWKIDNKERIDNLKSQSSKLILKEKLSNRKKWELVKKWKNEHFEKPSAEDISEDLTSKALHKHVAKDIINSSKFSSSSSSSSLLLSPLTSKTNVQEASKSHDDHSSNMKVFVSFQTHPTDSNNTILLERNSSEKSTPVLKNMESLDIMNSKQSCQNSQVDKMHTLESDVNETHNQPSGVDEESSKNSPSKESSAMKLDSKLKGMPNSEECLVEEAEDFDTPTYIESKEKKAKNKKAKSKHKTRHKTKSSRDGDVKKRSEKSQSKKLDKMSKSKSTKASRSRSQEARLKLERNCHHTGRVSRSNSRLENSKSRSRERQTRVEKARNQLEVHASKYSRHKEDHKDYESHYRDEERHEKRGKARPNLKRVRNFLSLDSSVEEVFSNNENTDNQGRVNSSIHDSSSSSEASSRVEVGKTIHSRWSQSSESDLSKASSTWQVDVEKQKPIQRRHDSKGKYEFKRKSSTKIRERLRQPRAAESSADETDEKKIVSGSSRTKHPKVAIDLQDSFSLEVGSERKNCKESKNNKEHKMVSECKSKSDDMTKGSKGSISTDADKASLDLGVSHSVYISSVPSLKENAFNQETEKTQVNTSSTICQNIGKDQVELSSLGRAPLRISFKPRAVLKNVNKLAEASIKFASSKFNSLYMKKSTKNDDNFENKLSTSGSKTPPTKMIIGSPLSTGVHKIMSGEKRSDRSTVSKENEARAEKRVVLNSQSNKQENGNDHRKNHSLRKEDEKSRRIRSSCDSTHSARSSRSTERKKSISRRRIRSSSSSRRSYSSRSRGRSWRRGRSRTYSSRRSYRSRSRSNSRRRSRRLGRFRRDGRSTYSSRDSSRRNYNSRSRSRSRRRRRTYSSRSSSRGGCRRLRSYRDWSSFSSRVTSRSRSSRTYSRSGSRRRNRLSERKYIGSGKKRSPSDSPRRTSSESLTADSDASSKDGDAEKSTKEGNLVYECGDILHDRYEILSTLGTGTFSKVVQCVDLKSDKHVALKIIKNIPKYREAAELEISILKDIAAKDPNDENFCIRMHSTFEHLDHWCLVFDSMGLNLYEFLKNNSYQPYMMEQIRHVGFQLVKAVKFLHGIGLMHTDLKPENVLFVNSDFSATTSTNKGKKFYHELRHTDIRLIDFGSAVYDHETHEDVVSTRQYRAVEVILGIGWNRSCDVWSVGCILFEMYAGHTLFQTHSNLEHLVMMEAILGPLPSRMIRKTEKNYFSGGRLKWDSSSREGRCIKKNCKPFKNYMLRGEMDHQDLFELMLLMLTYEPQDRITAEKALEDRFFARLSGRR